MSFSVHFDWKTNRSISFSYFDFSMGNHVLNVAVNAFGWYLLKLRRLIDRQMAPKRDEIFRCYNLRRWFSCKWKSSWACVSSFLEHWSVHTVKGTRWGWSDGVCFTGIVHCRLISKLTSKESKWCCRNYLRIKLLAHFVWNEGYTYKFSVGKRRTISTNLVEWKLLYFWFQIPQVKRMNRFWF